MFNILYRCPRTAGATVIEKHEKEKKAREGLRGAARGRQAASIGGRSGDR